MPPEKIQKVSDNELIIAKRKGYYLFSKYLSVVLVLCFCALYIYLALLFLSNKNTSIYMLAAAVIIGLAVVYSLYSSIIRPLFIVDTIKRVVKEDGSLLINNKRYLINEHSGIYFRFESTFPGRGSGYYVVGLRLRAPSKIKNIPLLTCPKGEMVSYALYLSKFTGLNIEDDIEDLMIYE